MVVAGRTAVNRAVRFGGEHDPLDERGRRDVVGLGPVPGPLLAGPELSVRQTTDLLVTRIGAEQLGWVRDDPQLASLDVGRWRGCRPEDVDPTALGRFFLDPDACPHGGETLRTFVDRIRGHVAALPPEVSLVVAGPVAQAVLCESVDTFFAAAVRPASVRFRS